MGDNCGTAGGTGGYNSVNQGILVTHCRNPPRVDGKTLLKEEARNFLRAYDAYCRRTEDDRTAGVQCKLYKVSKLLSYSQKDAISLFYFGGRGLTEEMLAERVRKIAVLDDSDAELDLGQLERDITRKLKLSPGVRVCDQAFCGTAESPRVSSRLQIVCSACAERAVGERTGCHRGKGDFSRSDATRFSRRRASSCVCSSRTQVVTRIG